MIERGDIVFLSLSVLAVIAGAIWLPALPGWYVADSLAGASGISAAVIPAYIGVKHLCGDFG